MGFAAAALALPAAAAQLAEQPAYVSRCEPAVVDAGRPEARWALVDGVYEDERDPRGRDFTWTRKRWQAAPVLEQPGARTLAVTGRPSIAGTRLRAVWNGHDLGTVELAAGWATHLWQVPAAATRAGPNRLEFQASKAAERVRQLGFCLDRLEVGPVEPDCAAGELRTAAEPVELAAGEVWQVSLEPLPRARFELAVAGQPGAAGVLYLSRGGRLLRHLELAVPAGGRDSLAFGDGNRLADALVVIARGPGELRLELAAASGDPSTSAWRVACGLWWREALLAAALVGLLGLGIRRRWQLPGGRYGPWLDAALLLALAAAVRFAYVDGYPEPDPMRFGDSWEYLRRARYLLAETSLGSLLRDTTWHAWLSWIRPPGYYLLLAAVLGPLGGDLDTVAAVQAGLLSATALATYHVAYPLFGRGAALAAGLLFALNPETVLSASWILSDPLSLFLTTAGLACLSWLVTRPGWPLALATGGLFGLACLVRSAPLYFVPVAAGLVYLAQRRPRRKAPAVVLLGATLAVVVPWCVRNSLIYDTAMGIDDLVLPNFLMAHPDPELLPGVAADDDGPWGGDVEARRQAYYRKLWRANKDGELTRASGRILRRGLGRMAANPRRTLRLFGRHLAIYFQPFPAYYARSFLPEEDGCIAAAWTDALNTIYLASLLLALAGALLAARTRGSWPLLWWIVYFVVVTNLFFYPSYMPGRYRLPIYPALAALAGLAISRGLVWLAGRRAAGGERP